MRKPRRFKYSGSVSKRRHLRVTADVFAPHAGSAFPPVTSASMHDADLDDSDALLRLSLAHLRRAAQRDHGASRDSARICHPAQNGDSLYSLNGRRSPAALATKTSNQPSTHAAPSGAAPVGQLLL